MRTSAVRLVRKGFLSSFFGGSKPKSPTTRPELSETEKEKLKSAALTAKSDRSVEARKKTSVSSFAEESDEFITGAFDKDEIRARGFLPYKYNYDPPSNIAGTIEELAREVLLGAGKTVTKDGIKRFEFKRDNKLKFDLISRIAERVSHWPLNSSLVHMDTVEDVIEFYKQPVQNISNFQKLARSSNLPENVHILEDAVRFHPEDTHLWHGGVTAFPGQGGKVLSLRNKRLYRQFKPKEEWFDYEELNFDYTPVDKGMPWDPEIAKKMDSFAGGKYSASKKRFHSDVTRDTGYSVDIRDSPFKEDKPNRSADRINRK